MFKRNIKITKDYFSLVKFRNKYLITFIIVDLINVLVSLLIPYFISLIVENVTSGFYNISFVFRIHDFDNNGNQQYYGCYSKRY